MDSKRVVYSSGRLLGKSWWHWRMAHLLALKEAVAEGREVYWIHSAKRVVLLSLP